MMMFHKALWYQNYKQTRMIIWMTLALFVVFLPFQSTLALETWKELQEQAQLVDDSIYEVQQWDVLQIFSEGGLAILVTLSIIVLAGMLVGLERNTRRNDFTFSLPFYRNDLFLAKWFYGAILISLFHSVNFWIAYFIIYQSEFASALYLVSWTEIFWGPLLGFLFFFTFSLFIGTIAGELISQIALTIVFAIFPLGLFTLIQGLIDVHFKYYLNQPVWLEYVTPFMYVFSNTSTIATIITAIAFTVFFLLLGTFLYKKNKIEHNGEFLIFKRLNLPFLILFSLCFSLLGGMIISSLAPWNADALRIVSYWIGFTLFLLFSLLIARRLLAMNLMISNKA